MALTITQRPNDFCAGYLPIEYKMTSTRMPNSRSGESSLGTLYGLKTSQSANNSPVEVGSQILVRASLFDAAAQLIVGAYVLLENAGAYSGVHRITEVSGSGLGGQNLWEFKIDAVAESSVAFSNVTYTDQNGDKYHPISATNAVTVSKYYNNYSAVADLYISGNFVARLRKKVNVDDEFIFDISTILQEYIGSDLATLGSTTLYQDSVDLSKQFYIQYAHEFDVIDSSGTATTTIGSFQDDVSNTKTAVNSVIPYVNMRDFVISSTNYNLDDYAKSDTGQSQLFLTNQPSEIKIGRSDHYALSWINNVDYVLGSAAIIIEVRLVVTTFDSQGNQIAKTFNVIKGSSISWRKTQSVLVGTSNLGSLITSETVKYEVSINLRNFPISGAPSSSTLTEIKTFIIDDNCYRDEFRFEWLNKLGGIDAYTFTGKHSKTSEIEKEVFKRSLNSARSIPERQTTTLKVDSKDIHNVNSGIVNYETRLWLDELLESPEVYLVVGSYRLPVQITGSYDYEKLAEDSYNVGFEFELAYDKITQRN